MSDPNTRLILRPDKAREVLPFLCFDCGKTATRLYHAGSCRACLRDADMCLECGADTDGATYCPIHEPEPEEDDTNAKRDYWLNVDIDAARGGK